MKVTSLDELRFISYVVPQTAYDNLLIGSPCIIQTILTVVPAAAGTIVNFYDGLTSAGTLIYTLPAGYALNAQYLRLWISQGLYLQIVGAGAYPSLFIVAATLPF
jgi:hypothetical protein